MEQADTFQKQVLLVGREAEEASKITEGQLKELAARDHQKGGSVVVGIQHGVCGGCHMKFPVQLVVSCQAARELVTCPNCGRILYYTRDMDLAVTE